MKNALNADDMRATVLRDVSSNFLSIDDDLKSDGNAVLFERQEPSRWSVVRIFDRFQSFGSQIFEPDPLGIFPFPVANSAFVDGEYRFGSCHSNLLKHFSVNAFSAVGITGTKRRFFSRSAR